MTLPRRTVSVKVDSRELTHSSFPGTRVCADALRKQRYLSMRDAWIMEQSASQSRSYEVGWFTDGGKRRTGLIR